MTDMTKTDMTKKETKGPCCSRDSLRIASHAHAGDLIPFLATDRARNFHRSRRERHVMVCVAIFYCLCLRVRTCQNVKIFIKVFFDISQRYLARSNFSSKGQTLSAGKASRMLFWDVFFFQGSKWQLLKGKGKLYSVVYSIYIYSFTNDLH